MGEFIIVVHYGGEHFLIGQGVTYKGDTIIGVTLWGSLHPTKLYIDKNLRAHVLLRKYYKVLLGGVYT